MRHESLPVVIIGGGPIGLAAAAHAVSRGLQHRFSGEDDPGEHERCEIRYGWSMPEC